ncbi:hypothetical protein SAMN05428642_1111 [Flaviramulus basaltis]|uniref:SnoaL-like domain-containing protein n=1 Tax=Flaviramulus basaltis TaxID=369401 RepID=A0A1K2ISM1_9FLAO|nr:hypothetical protein [Flaviramulus basaltis]SFZ95184.1 hypothetical protein SAMN05428642_1111 [Flaviramulus basaltis]
MKTKTNLLLVLTFVCITTAFGQKETSQTNGTIHNTHKNIDTEYKVIKAMEQNDFDTAFGYYRDDATFASVNDEPGTIFTKEQAEKYRKLFHQRFKIVSMEMKRPSLYLEFDKGNGEVFSWWVFHLIRQSDQKEILMPIHFINSFDENGKIINEFAYYSDALAYGE